ncbi:MAG: TIR domain-containing protein, partial [bacterium]
MSHNSPDKPRVRALAKKLRAAGLRVWFDEWVIKPGDDIYLSIERGLEAARAQVLCLSPAALGSEWVALERSTVIFRDPTNAGRRFIPLLLADCDLPDALRRYKHLDYRLEGKMAFAELLAACRPETESVPPLAETKPAKKPAQAEPLAVQECKFAGHGASVNSVAVSPDGTWAASGSDDKTVKIWDLETGSRRAMLKGHSAQVSCVAITPDGRWIICSYANTICVWVAMAGTPVTSWQASNGLVRSVAAMSDSRRAISAGDYGFNIWRIATRQCLATLNDHSPSYSLAVSSDEKRAVSGSFDGSIQLWDIETRHCLATLKGHSKIVNSIQITPDGRFAVSASYDKTVKIWDLEAEGCVGTLEGHRGDVYSVAISPGGDLIASTGVNDWTIRLWDLRSGACLQVLELKGKDSAPTAIAFDPNGARLVAGTGGGKIYIYRLTGVRAAPPAEETRRYVNAKVVLIGEGTVGKTSLAHRLIEDRYVIRDRTHGMNVWPLDLPLPPDATLQREALLWDLAGQEDYRLIHRLFLEETALALLLINPQKNDPFAEAGDWLKALETVASVTSHHAPEHRVPRLLVFSQIDVGGMKMGNAKIERFREQHGFAGWLETSAKTGQHCSDTENGGRPSKLKQMIADHI